MRNGVAVALLAATLGPSAGARAGDEKPPLGERAGAAVDRGVEWLRGRQARDGSWGMLDIARAYNGGSAYDYPVGPTAFALYTLLKCGVAPDDAGIQRGFQVVRKRTDFFNTYEIACAILAVEAKYDQAKRSDKAAAAAGMSRDAGKTQTRRVKPSKDDAAWLRKLLDGLCDHFKDGGWRYRRADEKRVGADQDMSNTAMAMLAILAAHRCGVDVPRRTLSSVVEWTVSQQDADGPAAAEYKPQPGVAPGWKPPAGARSRGWAYCRKTDVPSEPTTTTGNMTTAGLITLLSAQLVLDETGPETLRGLQPSIDKAIADGLTWLAFNWQIEDNPPKARLYHFMYLYGLERVGDLRGVALLAGHDWYTEGAELLLRDQRKDGSWLKTDTHKPYDLLNTCFALLFLDRASLVVTTPR